MTTSTDIYDTIKANRLERMKTNNKIKGELSNNTLKKYTSSVNSIYRQLNIDEPMTPEFFIKHIDEVKNIINNVKSLSSQNSLTTAMYVYTNYDAYNTIMMEKIKNKTEEMKKREKCETQKANWMTKKEVYNKLDQLEVKANEAYDKHSLGNTLSEKDHQDIQDYMLLLLQSDKHMPIRRSLDWIAFKIKDINRETDNYMTEDASALVFNTYKTAGSNGKQELKFNKYKYRNRTDWDFYSKKGAEVIKRELLRWIAVNPTEYLFFTTKFRKPLSAYNLTNWFHRIFDGKKVSTNMLRNILMTERHNKILNQFEQARRAIQVGGSSANMLMNYVKT